MILAVEGADGSGKATQAGLLNRRLQDLFADELKHKTMDEQDFLGSCLLSFPAYDEHRMGKFISRYLKGQMGKLYDNNPFLSSLLYALDRFESKEEIERMIKKYRAVVVCDRYVYSNIAHQAGKLWGAGDWRSLAADIEEVEFDVLGLRVPDLTFYLDLTAEQSYARTHARDGDGDIHQDAVDYMAKVRQVYLSYVDTHPSWHLIRCFTADGQPRSIEDIHNEIFSIFSLFRKARQNNNDRYPRYNASQVAAVQQEGSRACAGNDCATSDSAP